MGGSSWSNDSYTDRVVDRAARGVDTFDYSKKVTTGAVAAKVHDSLNPFKVTRESRDSDAHPQSVAIGVIFDVTGSMHTVPVVLQKKLPQLMGLLLRKGYVQDPQVLFGAIGDYFADKIPLQIGQFESGIEMEDNMTNLVLESGGGGTYEESYQNALYFFAHHTSIDCLEKRGKKGYLFLIGDEKPYAFSRKAELSTLMGDVAQADVPLADILAAVQKKYTVFFIIPKGTSHGEDPSLRKCWADLLGPQNVLVLESAESVCETIGLAIGLCEGTADGDRVAADLKDIGAHDHVATAVASALDPLAKSTALARAGSGNLPERAASPSSSARL